MWALAAAWGAEDGGRAGGCGLGRRGRSRDRLESGEPSGLADESGRSVSWERERSGSRRRCLRLCGEKAWGEFRSPGVAE